MKPIQYLYTEGLSPLRRAWRVRLVLVIAFLIAAASFLALVWSPANALRWLPLALVISAYVLAVLWRGLPLNHRQDDKRLFASLGAANDLTFSRGILTAALAGFLLTPRPEGWLIWLPGALYSLVGLSDMLDGILARRSGRVTRLGALLDMSLDGVGVLFAVSLAVHYGQVPAWYLLVGLARYLFLFGSHLRTRRGLPLYELPPSILRRALASSQMAFLGVVLFPVFSSESTWLAAYFFGLPFLINFLRDWLFVSGVLRPKTTAWNDAALRWLPLALRLTVVLLMAGPLSRHLLDHAAQVAMFAARGLPLPQVGALLFAGLDAVVVLLLVFGAAGRISAIFGLLLLAIQALFMPIWPVQVVAAFVYTIIIYLGTGPLSMWTPEDALFTRAIRQVS